MVDLENENPVKYVFMGIFGGYLGKFSINRYYLKIAEYNELENRDIWEFELNLKPDEIRKIYGLYGTKMESENVTGGPFVSYIFDKPESNRVLIASGFVNFPGKYKVFHIKELEYILETAKLNKTTKE